MFIGMIDAEAEAPILWSSDAKNRFIDNTLMLRNTEGKRKRWQQRIWLDSITDLMDMHVRKFWENFLPETVKDLAWCSPWGCKELDLT